MDADAGAGGELERATCRGCAAPVDCYANAPAGYCCAWCAMGLRCPCEHGRGYTLLSDDQPRLFDLPMQRAPS